jgi:hypothetical protein
MTRPGEQKNAKGEETFIPADTVIAAGPRKANQELSSGCRTQVTRTSSTRRASPSPERADDFL